MQWNSPLVHTGMPQGTINSSCSSVGYWVSYLRDRLLLANAINYSRLLQLIALCNLTNPTVGDFIKYTGSSNMLDGNYTRMLRAILNKSWRQHPTRHQLYGHLPPITKTIQVRRTRHTGHCWRSKDERSDVLLWTPHMAKQKQEDQYEHTYSSYVRIQDVALKTCKKR